MDAVDNALPGGAAFFLQGDNFAKTLQSQKGRLAAVPGKLNGRIAAGPDMPADIYLQQIIRHHPGF